MTQIKATLGQADRVICALSSLQEMKETPPMMMSVIYQTWSS